MKLNELRLDEYLDYGLETVSIHPFTFLKWRTLPFDQKATLLNGVRLISQHTSLYHTASIVVVLMLSVATEPLNIYLCHGIQIAFFSSGFAFII
jgi:hypothetical protein